MNPPCFSRSEKVRFRDVDGAGIVFYPRFLEMLNNLVEDWFADELGLPFEELHLTHGVPTVDLKVQFRAAARLGEVLEKRLQVRSLGSSSVDLAFAFHRADGSLCLEGEARLVYVEILEDRKKIRACPIPETLKKKMENRLMPAQT